MSVTDADVWADQQFAADHPGRRYWLRDGWAVRRRGRSVFLRTRTQAGASPVGTPSDSEELAERIWWQSAWPDLSPLVRRQMAKAARHSVKTRPDRSAAIQAKVTATIGGK